MVKRGSVGNFENLITFDYIFLDTQKLNFWSCICNEILTFLQRYKLHTETNFYFWRRFYMWYFFRAGSGGGASQNFFCDLRWIFRIRLSFWLQFLHVKMLFRGGGGSGGRRAPEFFCYFRCIFSTLLSFFLIVSKV